MRKGMFLFAVLATAFFNLSGIEVTQGKYSFSIDDQDYVANPKDLSGDETQGMAHVKNDHWFLSKRRNLDVYDSDFNNYFSRDNQKNLLSITCVFSDDEKCIPLAHHMGDVDFNQEQSLLYNPLENLYINDDDSGYSVYEWDKNNRDITLKKLIILESGRNGSSAPYAAYNSIDGLVYLHGYGNEGDLCQGNRICGYNPENTIETTVSKYLNNKIDEAVEKKEETLAAGLELREYVTNGSESGTVLSENASILFNRLCPSGVSSENCNISIEDTISYNQASVSYLTYSSDTVVHKTKAPEKVIIMTAVCGEDWACNPAEESECIYLFQKDGKNYCEVNHSKDSGFVKQGAVFSPNHRMLFYVHHSDSSSKAKVHVYYFPLSEVLKFHEPKLNEPIYAVFAGIINKTIDPGAGKNEELEGMDIWAAQIDGTEYDIHLMMLNNDAGGDNYYIFHWSSPDYDGDGVKDTYDNCLLIRNPGQKDSDGNGFGDVCDPDIDSDNIYFEDDNCPNVYNPDQADYDDDGVGDVCDPCPMMGSISIYNPREDDDKDGIPNGCDNCPNVKNKFEAASLNDEIISAKIQECDDDDNWYECLLKFSFSGGASKNQERKNDGYFGNKCMVNFMGNQWLCRKVWYWQPDHDLDGIGDACDTDHSSVTKLISTTSSNPLFFRGKSEVNRFVDLNYKVIGDTTPGSTAKYCWMDLELMDEWGKGGYCTTSDLGKGYPTINDSSFGYSHGGDPEPYNRQLNKLAWQTPKISSFMGKLSVVNKTKDSKSAIEKWDWTKNLQKDYERLYTTYVSSGQQNLKEPFINYAASVGSAGTENCSADEDYYDEEAEFINPACFRNFYINARAKRENKQGTKLSYYTENLRQNFFPFKITSEMLNSSEKSNSTCSGCVKFSDAVSSVTELWIYKDNILKSEKRKLNNADNIIATFNDEGSIISVFEGENEIYFGINDEDNPSEIILAGIAPKPQEDLIKGKGAVAKGRIFLTSANMLYSLEKDDSGQQTNIGSGMTYRFREIMQMPYPENEINVFSAGRELVMLRNNGQYYEPYILSGDTFIEIESDEYPVSRDSFSFSSDNWKMYIAGGVTDGREGVAVHSDVWALDTAYGWRKIADSINIDMGDVLIKEENGILNIFSRTFPQKEVATAFINIATGETDYGKTILESEFEAMDIEKYCISRKNDNTYPGKEFRNICSPAEDYQYKSYTFPDYKFSLAGIDDFVFSGGLSGIRTFRINAAGGLENGDLDVVGTVNSLAVKDNALYSSRSNKVFVFEVKENGDLVKRKEISTSGCDQIRVSGNMLFTGENGKVNIYDITDPFNPVKKQTVSLSMNVVDLEVWNEYLFVFHDKWFSSSKLAMFRFSDEGTIVKTDEVKLSCSDPEFMSDSQNVYLGCKNGQKKIEFNESEKLVIKSIGGSKNYFRDTYLRNGIIYTVHSGRIFLSK